jgi:hypothetical protein
LAVIPTVDGAADGFINEVKPQAFMFCALDDSDGRKMFYDGFSNKMAEKYQYKYERKKIDTYEFYILTKNENKKELDKSLRKIVDENK